MSRRRAAVLVSIHLVFALHLAHWWMNGRTLSPIEPSEAMQTLEQGRINAGFLFFGAAILLTLVFGRFFCGWGCHVVALQDLCAHLMRRAGIRPRLFRSRILAWVPVALALYMFAWPSVKRVALFPLLERAWPAGAALLGQAPAFPGFHVELLETNFWQSFAPWAVAIPFLLVCGFAVVYLLGSKGFCAYGCPYGGIFGPVDRFAAGQIVVDPSACEQCGHCTATCTSNVRVHEEVATFGRVVDSGCMKCLDCVSVCPNDALTFRLTTPFALTRARPSRRPARGYDLTRGQELLAALLFLGVFLGVRGAYRIVPMLMAVGVALCVVFLVFLLVRLARSPEVSLHTWHLKTAGTMTTRGRIVAAGTITVLALVAHTALVRFELARGDALDARVNAPRAEVLRASAALSPEIRERADAARTHLRRAAPAWRGGLGLLPTAGLDLRLAWLDLVSGRRAEALATLESYAASHAPSADLLGDLATILEADGRRDDAVARTQQAFALAPEREDLRAALATRLVAAGRHAEAIELLREAVARTPDSARWHHDLAAVLYLRGDLEEALAEMRKAAELSPEDATLARRLSEMERRASAQGARRFP